MDKDRFSLLLLDPGEIYFEDFSAVLVNFTSSENAENKNQIGRLKMCSKSLVFEPKNLSLPLIKIPLRECKIIEKRKSKSKFLKDDNVINVCCNQYIEMLEGNLIAPYKFCSSGNYLFQLNYAKVEDCLTQICQLHRASTLPAAEQADMIAAIVHSRQSRVSFDPLWLDLYEKIILETQADKITPLVVNPGRILLSTERLYFQPYNNIEPYPVLKINLSNIKKMIKRRFLLRHVGLEIYLDDNSNISYIYLALRNAEERDKLYDKMLEQPLLKLIDLQQDVMTLQWQNGVLSNYDYLLYLNSLADRTTNDLTQYPVFPWVITDYTSDKLDLSDPKMYRDLSKPIGALNPERLRRLLERAEEMSYPKFIYGSHYSTPGFVLFYLVRLYPNYMLCLQSGRFDHPDRMFNSVPDVFKNCLSNMSDFKELVPEFYDTEQEGKFLVNNMGINFGYRLDGTKVADVELPSWAYSPRDFVRKLRDALESEHVSRNLHNWIDLIFGYKQRGEEAEKTHNLFYYLCYEGSLDLDSIRDHNQRHASEVQIMEFGQIPKQIFTVPHPQRILTPALLQEPFSKVVIEDVEDDSNHSTWKNLQKLELKTSFGTHRNIVSSILITIDNSRIISVGHDYLLKVFSVPLNRQVRSASFGSMPLSSCIQLPNKNILVVGSWDNTIIIYDLDFGRITQTVAAHEDAISCLVWGNTSNLLASGSWDCTVRVWQGLTTNATIKHSQSLLRKLDHDSHIICLAFNQDDSCLASGTKDGNIFIWNMSTFELAKQISGHCGDVEDLSFSPDGRKLVSCGKDKTFQVVDLNTGMVLYNKTMSSSLTSLFWDGFILLLGSENGILFAWDLLEVKLLYQLQAHKGAIRCVRQSSDKNFAATCGDDHFIRLWTPS